MRPVLLRRLLVFGVCLAGACSLYVAPSLAGPGTVRPTASDELLRPIAAAADTTGAFAVQSVAQVATDPSDQAAEDANPAAQAVADHLTLDPLPPPPQSTPFAPGTQTDQVAPGSVAPAVVAVTGDTLDLGWPAATDDVGVVAYRVEVNGFERVVTDQLRVSLPWAPSDGDVNTVAVRAVDAAGNRSTVAAPILVTRPAPVVPPTVPAPAPEPAPATPSPTPSTPAPREPGPAPSESAVEVSPLPRVAST